MDYVSQYKQFYCNSCKQYPATQQPASGSTAVSAVKIFAIIVVVMVIIGAVGFAVLWYVTDDVRNKPSSQDVEIVNVETDTSMYLITNQNTYDFTIVNKASATAFVDVQWNYYDDNYNPPNQYITKTYTIPAGSEESYTETITFTSNTFSSYGPYIVGTVEFSGW